MLEYLGKRIAVSHGATLKSGLMPPDAEHEGVHWIKVTINRAMVWPWPERQGGRELTGIRGIKEAILRDCQAVKNVCC